MPLITQSFFTAGSATSVSTGTTVSFTPTANNLQVGAVYAAQSSGAPVNPTITSNGLTWVEFGSVTQVGDTQSKIHLFRSMGASPGAGPGTIAFGTDQARLIWSFSEFANTDTTGANGAGAIVQTLGSTISGGGSVFVINLAAFGNADNATYGAFGENSGTTNIVVGVGFTEISDTTGGGFEALQTQWRNDNDTSVDVTINQANKVGLAVEIKAAAGAESGPLSYKSLLGVGQA